MNRAFDKPPSVEQLSSEIAKLALASYPDPISVEVVVEMLPQRAEERVFPLLDAVVGGNQRAALIETENALRAGEDVEPNDGTALPADRACSRGNGSGAPD